MTLLAYLLKLIVVSAILYGYYRLFLRNKRFHHYNRFFLLSALMLSIVLPFIRIPLLYQPDNPVHEAMYRTVSLINADYSEEITEAPLVEPLFTAENLLLLSYSLGALFLVTLLLRSLLYIYSLRKRYSAENITGLRFYNTKEPGTPFSFFRSIFWNEQLEFNSSEGQQIFRHELFHVRHRHSADRLLAEILTALFWFNPFFHLIKKELKAIHEFLADQFAISGSDRYAYATLLVQQALDPGKHAVTNHFFQNHIKRRIAMITQFQQSKYGYWSRVMVLPVALILFCFVTLYAKKPTPLNANETAVNTNAIIGENIIYDESPKQNQPAATATDTLPDKAKIEMEQMKLHQQRMKELQETKSQRYQETLNAQRADREILQKQMRERQLLLEQRQQNNKDFNEKALRLKLEMQSMQQQLENDMKVKTDRMEQLIRESQLKAKEDPAYREEHQKRMEQMKRELLALQDQTRKMQEAAQNTIRQQMLELKFRAEKEQQAQQEDLRILEQRVKELQDTVPAKKAKEAKPAKSQQPAKGAKTKVEKVKEVELPAGKVRKVQEVKVENEEEVEEVREVRKAVRPVEERRVIKQNGTTRVLLRPNPDSVGRTRRVIIADNRKVQPRMNLNRKVQPKEVPQKRTLKIKPKPQEGSAPVSDQDSNETNSSEMALFSNK